MATRIIEELTRDDWEDAGVNFYSDRLMGRDAHPAINVKVHTVRIRCECSGKRRRPMSTARRTVTVHSATPNVPKLGQCAPVAAGYAPAA